MMQGQKGDCDLVRLLPSSADECTYVRENCKTGRRTFRDVANKEVSLWPSCVLSQA